MTDDDVDVPLVDASDSDLNLFRTVLFAAHKELPNLITNDLLDFIRSTGGTCNYRDISDQSLKDIQKSLVHVIDNNLCTFLGRCKVFGLLCDESTDIAVHKKLILYVRYVKDGKMTTELVGNSRIPDGTADSIVTHVKEKVRDLGLDLRNAVGLGSDGASVMTGVKNGVGVQLLKSAPGLVHVHCLAHRLALACSDAAKQFDYLKAFKGYVNTLHYHFASSAVRQSKLEAIQRVFGELKA